MRDIAFTAIFLAMLPAALRFGHVGAMLWAWVAMIAPNNYLYGFARGLPFNKIVVAVALLSLFLDRGMRRKLYFDSHVRALLLFFAVAMISYVFALSDRARVDELADRLFKVVILCMFMLVTIRGRLQIHSLMIAICMGMSIHGAIEAAKFIATGGGHILLGPATFGDNNHFGLAILMVIPPLVYLYRYSLSLIVRIALAFAIAGNVAGVIATNSRGALLGMVAVGVSILWQSKHKARALVIVALLGGIGAAIAPERWYQRMNTIGSAESDGSFLSRVSSWKMNLLVALDRPLTGGGFSAMEDYAVFSAYLPQFSMLDFIPTAPPTIAFAAHSIYFQVLGDTGFLGLALFLSLLYLAFRNTRIIMRLAKDRQEFEWAYDAARFLRFTLIAYTVSGAALSLAYFEFYYIVITLISLIRRTVQETLQAKLPAGQVALRSAGPGFAQVTQPGLARQGGRP